ncbi:MFS general substrate transporter [Stereum hirsutum FP-91666 SS1]|uniref:MFS general substrate transporter n=1 Tax=Stereum hirsutum (strain FP-91666) TaxID=721885 RepID=UPI0004409D0B|nr:MFS general substrate transporter [Stereum hirsutum FP-91666 SS1]EIM91216.1 MFS general substrate transporter [Stereum hirsutum FP-91666 SS1]
MSSSLHSVEKEGPVDKDEQVLARVSSAQKTNDVAVATVNASEEYSEADFERIRRKQDWILMPLMWIAYGIQQVDKTGLSTQATFGIKTDTHMVGNDYAWLTTIFYIFFLFGEFPGNWFMQRYSVGKTLAVSMFAWGVIVFCTAAAKNWTDLMIMRALQGFTESIVSPAFLLITGLSYRKEEHAMRVLIWGTANYGFAVIVSLINYGIGTAAQKHPSGLAAWKGMSIFLGALTIIVSVASYFFLGTPREVRWLTAEEKKIQAARVAHNNTGSDAQKRTQWKWSQVTEAFLDPQLYFFFFVTVSNAIPTGGVNTFGNIIFVSLGFSALDTLVKGTLPQNVLGVFWFILAGWVLSRFKHMRFYWIMISIVPAFIGMLVLSLVPTTSGNLWAKWGAYFITITGQICGALVWSMLSTNVAGRTKKSVVSIVIFCAYCFGNAIGAQVFQDRWAPAYRPSTIILAIMFALEFVLMGVWRVYYVMKNKRRATKLDARGVSPEERVRLGSLMGETDATDLENEYFIYDY